MEIEINDLYYKYPSYQKEALTDINLNIGKSKITGIIGKNGSGKTTLLNLISNTLSNQIGTIKYNKTYILDKKLIGYSMQDAKKQFFCNTVKEEIELGAKINKYRIEQIEKRIYEVLKIVKLDTTILTKNPLEISNSDAKKVSLASILIYNPKLIILDEPTLYLDNKSKEEIIKLLKLLKNRYNKTIIVVSHDIDLIHKICDEIIVLNKGKIVLKGDKYTVFKDTKKIKKYGILPPKIMMFSDKVLNKKGIKIGYRDDINDLIKDIFRNVY